MKKARLLKTAEPTSRSDTDMAIVTTIAPPDKSCYAGITPEPPFTLGIALTETERRLQLSRGAIEIARILDMCERVQAKPARGDNRLLGELIVSCTSRENDDSAELDAAEFLRDCVLGALDALCNLVRRNWEDSSDAASIGEALDELQQRLNRHTERHARTMAAGVIRAYHKGLVTPTATERALMRDPLIGGAR